MLKLILKRFGKALILVGVYTLGVGLVVCYGYKEANLIMCATMKGFDEYLRKQAIRIQAEAPGIDLDGEV